jgi:putative transposase
MNMQNLEQIAAFRYGLIAPVVSRQSPLLPGELKSYLLETSQRDYDAPSEKERISVRTLERYLAAYRAHGWEGLKPKPRTNRKPTAITPEILELAMNLRRERPERSVEQIIFCLEEGGHVDHGAVAASTLSRYFQKAGLTRADLLADPTKKGTFRRFEAEDVNFIWQFDFQHTLYLPDPNDPDRRKKAMLFAIIDDFSRYIVHCEFYWDEKLPRMEDSLKKAILKHGIPERFYCDNGAAFSSGHLVRICAKLGIHLSHSRPYRPQGRGKIERMFRFIDTSFKPEAYQLITEGTVTSLAELNEALASWVDGYYHRRKHGTTKETPAFRLAGCTRAIRRKTFSELNEIFLWEEQRQSDKTACIKLYGNVYEIDSLLARSKVLLRFDPFDLNTIQVWQDNKRFADAKPLDVYRPIHSKVGKIVAEKAVAPVPTGISLIALAEAKRQAAIASEPLSFSTLMAPKKAADNAR